jgi:predicted PurR-regulated permease PerM
MADLTIQYNALPQDAQSFLKQQHFGTVVDEATRWANQVVSSTLIFFSHLLEVVLIPVLAFYFTLDPRSLKREFLSLVPKAHVREVIAIAHEINAIMRSYIIGQIILCVAAGLVVGVLLHLFGMPYQLILGVFAGVTRAVPVIGPIFSGAVIVLLGLAKSPMTGVDLLICFVLLHFIESKFVMPKLIGERMHLHPALIILVLLIGAEFFGVFGMFMAAPVAAVIRVLVRYYLIKPKKLHVWGMPHNGVLSHPISEPNETKMAEVKGK